MNIKEEVEKRFDEMFGTLENIEKRKIDLKDNYIIFC